MTDDPHATGRIAFCMTGSVVKADVRADHIVLTFKDGRTASIAGCYLEVLFDFPGTQQDALQETLQARPSLETLAVKGAQDYMQSAKSIAVELEAAGSAEAYAEGTAIDDLEPPSAGR